MGLASRRYPAAFPAFIATYAGDTLWAMMVFWVLRLIWRGAPTMRLALATLAISYTVEASQLVRLPWLDALRSTRLGGLALGQGFQWSDLVCYAVGSVGAAMIDHALRRRSR